MLVVYKIRVLIINSETVNEIIRKYTINIKIEN